MEMPQNFFVTANFYDNCDGYEQKSEKHDRSLKKIAPAHRHITAEKSVEDNDHEADNDACAVIHSERCIEEFTAADDFGGCVDDHKNDDGQPRDECNGTCFGSIGFSNVPYIQ